MIGEIFVGIADSLAFIVIVSLVTIDRDESKTKKVVGFLAAKFFKNSSDSLGVSSRLFSAFKSYLLVFFLFILLGVIFYFTS